MVVEAKIEFERNLVVPHGVFNHRSVDIMYNGASVEALKRLGEEKGYRLIGANKQGYNLFFVKEDELVFDFPVASTKNVLDEPETIYSFYANDFFDNREFFVP